MTAVIRQSLEIFHLLFLRYLGEHVSKEHFVLNGGCNLRFFFKSIRYSEDLDLDIKITTKETLKTKIRKILNSSSFANILESRDILLQSMSEPKQTDTTQRWKISMRVSGNSIAIPTKIEFSRRSANGTALFEAIDPELTQNYKLYPIYTNHYDRQTAIQQKILALALRAATQARDVFDLEQLVSPYINMAQSNVSNKNILLAQENAMSINYGDFKSQVVAYLLLEYQLLYTKERWEKLLEKVVEYLERLKP